MDTNMIMARSLAPEDISVGYFVMTLNTQKQFLVDRCSQAGEEILGVQRLSLRPDETRLPRKVVGVCLPFVIVRDHNRMTEVIDTRSTGLARVGEAFAKAALKPHIKKREAKSSGKKPTSCKRCRSK